MKSSRLTGDDDLPRLDEAKEPHQITFIWVKGHDGHPQNERCDTLATTAADGGNLVDDVEVYKRQT